MQTIEIYVSATLDMSLEAIQRSVEQFVTGKVERENRAFAPSTDEFAGNVRRWHDAILSKAGEGIKLHTGILNMDFGAGSIDMRGLTEAEQDQVIAAKGRAPDGSSLAYRSLPEIREALQQKDLAQVTGGKTFAAPRLGRMQ